MRQFPLYALLLVAVGLISCSDDDPDVVILEGSLIEADLIRFEASVGPRAFEADLSTSSVVWKKDTEIRLVVQGFDFCECPQGRIGERLTLDIESDQVGAYTLSLTSIDSNGQYVGKEGEGGGNISGEMVTIVSNTGATVTGSFRLTVVDQTDPTAVVNDFLIEGEFEILAR